MAIRTMVTEIFTLDYPIVLAPMGWISGGRLAAAVSNAGGLGLVGGGYGDATWLRPQLELVHAETTRPWGVGFITWHAEPAAVEEALSFRPAAVFFSFGDPHPSARLAKAAGCTVICQVQEVEEARHAVASGADIIVAQGTEAGGHGARRATLPLIPAVVDAVAPIPVLAAGGIADGRGLAAVLMLGAQGAVIGTRFFAATESLGHEAARQRIVAAGAQDTARTRVFDAIRGYEWPLGYTGRALRNRFFEQWHGRETDLDAALATEMPIYADAVQKADFDAAVVFAGEAVDLIHDVAPAAELVRRIGAEAEARLRSGSGMVV
jgi:nitronate monooxygenase